ncbi:hypothetical protein ACRAWG_11530 [Methylobacterium sp. P31]
MPICTSLVRVHARRAQQARDQIRVRVEVRPRDPRTGDLVHPAARAGEPRP